MKRRAVPLEKMIVRLIAVLLANACLPGASAGEPYLLFEGTASPDGRFALAWGMAGVPDLETAKPEQLTAMLADKLVENYLIDLQAKRVLATLGSGHFVAGDFARNHGSLAACWRDDSRALLVVEGGKWASRLAAVVYLVEGPAGYDVPDVIPVTSALRRAIRGQLLKDHPGEAAAISRLEVSVEPLKWTAEDRVLLDATCEVPKAENTFGFDGQMTVVLPGPQLVAVAAGADPGLVITCNSAGRIKLGMTVAEARQAMGSASFTRSSDGEGVALISVKEGGVQLMTLYAREDDPEAPVDPKAIIDQIEVSAPGFITASGVHPGMALGDAEKRIGKLQEIGMSEIEAREYAQFAGQPSGLNFRLTHPDGAAGDYADGQNVTTRYLPGASIYSIAVSGRQIMLEGSIGGIKVGSTAADVLEAATRGNFGKLAKGKEEIWEAIDVAGQTWSYPGAGLTLTLVSDKPGGPKSVFSITIEGASPLRTGQGIGIGSPKADVVSAYADFKTEAEEAAGFFGDQGGGLLVGSIYGGMIFEFKGGKVSKIFLGPAAE